MRKTDKFIPVVTIVVYYGEEPWDAALSLCGILDIPDSIKGVVNDYKIRLVEARNNSLTLHNIDNIALFGLLSYLLNDTNNKTRKEIEGELEYYIKEHKIDNNVLLTAVAASRCNVNYETLAKKEGTNMISVFQRTWDEGKAEGKIEGEAAGIIKMGLFCGLSESDILDKLQSMLDIPLTAAQEYYKMFGKQTV